MTEIEILKDIVGAIDAKAIMVTGSADSIVWFEEWLHNARKAINGKGDSDFRVGLKEGLKMYAWWKDGTQWVGTCGSTLKQAIRDIDAGKYDFILGENTCESDKT